MSADDPLNGRKTLSPEFLPTPASGEVASPRQRVAERAWLLLRRFRGLGTTAGAAVLSLQCSGYGVVDPLPPPPLSCTREPNPFASIMARADFKIGSATPPAVVLVLSTPRYPPANFVGYSIGAVRVSGGTLVSIDDMSQAGTGGSTLFQLTVAPADSATAEILIDVDFACGGIAATKHYRIMYHLPTSANDMLVVDEIALPADAGTD